MLPLDGICHVGVLCSVSTAVYTTTTDFTSPILFAKKKDRRLRFYINYRKLNKITKNNRYPIFLVLEIVA